MPPFRAHADPDNTTLVIGAINVETVNEPATDCRPCSVTLPIAENDVDSETKPDKETMSSIRTFAMRPRV